MARELLRVGVAAGLAGSPRSVERLRTLRCISRRSVTSLWAYLLKAMSYFDAVIIG